MAGELEPMAELPDEKPRPRRCSVSSRTSRCRAACGCAVGAGPGAGVGGVWGAGAAEAVGTALLVLLPCLCPPDTPPLHRALAAGAVVTMLVQCFDHISLALLNPAVLVAAVVAGRVRAARAAALLPAQLVGGVVGAWLLTLVAGETACVACVTVPGAGVEGVRAACVEGVLTGCLALASCSAWDPRTRSYPHTWPLRLGAIVTALILTGMGVTGGSLNPARSLGPALLTGRMDAHWVYWAGPLCGAAGAALLYRALWGEGAPCACVCPHHDHP